MMFRRQVDDVRLTHPFHFFHNRLTSLPYRNLIAIELGPEGLNRSLQQLARKVRCREPILKRLGARSITAGLGSIQFSILHSTERSDAVEMTAHKDPSRP